MQVVAVRAVVPQHTAMMGHLTDKVEVPFMAPMGHLVVEVVALHIAINNHLKLARTDLGAAAPEVIARHIDVFPAQR